MCIILLSGMYFLLEKFKTSILNNPYPYTYEKPVTADSKTIYNGGSLHEFTKVLDSLADKLD